MDTGQRRTLAAATLGSFVALLDTTAVNVALPAVEAELGGGLAAQQWVVNAYLVLLGSLILVGGSLADLHGARRVFAIGAGGFGVVSLGCALAPSIEALVGLRAAQGAFGALLTPAALALVVAGFPAAQRGRAVGTWTAWSGIAAVAGPLVGGLLVDAGSWRGVFVLNVPVVAVALVLVAGVPLRDRARRSARVDWVGAALAALGLAGPTAALVTQPGRGWGDPLVLGGLAGGAALLAGFVAWERRHPAPMLPPGLFAHRAFAVANVQTLAIYAGLGITLFVLVIFLQAAAGFGAVEAGLATLPTTVLLFTTSRRFGALADRIGARPLLVAGPLVGAAGLLGLQRVGADARYLTDVLPGLAVYSLGLAMTVAPLTATVLAGVEERRAGIASAVNTAVARIAALLATASIAAVAGLPADLGAVAPAAAEAGLHRALLVAAGLVALGGLLALALPRRCADDVPAEDCPGGQLVAAPPAAAVRRQPEPQPAGAPAR